ncbi:hypothetical protein [Microbispora triticiradicis]|uniref:hypothetical protein n=1 Tax=Microbispora triticiradicis TaxID=2200763 RepID=UPI00296FEAFB|nr:hypothetical protein [Microbispora triticiradicis]
MNDRSPYGEAVWAHAVRDGPELLQLRPATSAGQASRAATASHACGCRATSAATGSLSTAAGRARSAGTAGRSHGGVHPSSSARLPGKVRPASRTSTGTSSCACLRSVVISVGRAGYAHYCTLLPTAFADDDTGLRQVGAMLGFLFTLESLALSLGCDRAQLELAIRQSHPGAPAKVALLWAAKTQLGLLPRDELRARCDELLASPLVVTAFPLYLSGFVQALEPVPALAAVGDFAADSLSANPWERPSSTPMPEPRRVLWRLGYLVCAAVSAACW